MVKLDYVDPHLYWEEKNTKGLTTKCLDYNTRQGEKESGRTGMALFKPPSPLFLPSKPLCMPLDKSPNSLALY
jgi:hypothetical protein